MAEDFDDMLGDIAGQAEQTTRVPGAQAARLRAQQRTVHQWFTASAVVIALIAAAGGIAAAAAGQGHGSGPAPLPPAHSGTAQPGRSASPNPDMSPFVVGRSNPGSAQDPDTPGSGSDYNTIVPEAWMPADELPGYAPDQWQPTASAPQILTGTQEQNLAPFAYACMSTTGFQDTVMDALGMQAMSYTSKAPGQFSNSPTLSAAQDMYFYPDAATASAAFTQAEQDLTNCPMSSGNAVFTSTPILNAGTGFAAQLQIHDQNGNPVEVDGNYSISAGYSDFLVLAGDVLDIVGTDTTQVSMPTPLYDMEAHACWYSGSCPTGSAPFSGNVTASGGTAVSPGGSPVEFTVSVTDDFASPVSGTGLVVSLGHCSCVAGQASVAPAGTLQLWDPASSSWQTVTYDAEGTGVDYATQIAVPNLDLEPGQTVTYTFRLSLNASQTQTVSSGTFDIDAGLHYGPSTAALVAPLADLPLTVNAS